MTADPRDAGVESDDVPPEPESAEVDSAEPDEAPAFANRAARRAKGKGSTPPPASGKGQHLGGRGSVQGPRQWGNRRSG
jgi:hypothetical protein